MKALYSVTTHSPEETFEEGVAFSKKLKPNDVIAFTGTLGAGKTVFTKGLAVGLGIEENITSPTFTLIQEYPAAIPLFHMDLYRLESVEELEILGGEDYFYQKGITVIEWSEKAKKILPPHTYYIDIQVFDEGKRIITIAQNESKEK